ncbi:Arc family DNA-binding protein [Thiothrix subterranea]|uniref:Arc family DNA-binding protein n=1 Tax=Thiothrix subterranea TaxID=2735563 RepID=A0AA51MNU3_9GAMM|nr:Arc family DNA-binding protein [Thiothrix subterranea]MDQ5769566.1 Arc family DNA-binding protein [Thiothrix subterranea]WML87149.1 Arc family DNA-binding protein [Thiothrix subterranea]
MSKEDQRIHPYPVRLTKELREKLDTAAKAAGRSLNAEMLLRLEASFSELSTDDQPMTAAQVRELIREELTKAGK